MAQTQIIVGMIRGRHDMPVSRFIFDEPIEDVHDYVYIRKHIDRFLDQNFTIEIQYGCGIDQADFVDIKVFHALEELVVYVTGLTSVAVELVNECLRVGVKLTLMEYDTTSGKYLPHPIS